MDDEGDFSASDEAEGAFEEGGCGAADEEADGLGEGRYIARPVLSARPPTGREEPKQEQVGVQ